MSTHELAALLLKQPDVEVTVNVWDGDYADENEVESLISWGSFVSIQHSRRR